MTRLTLVICALVCLYGCSKSSGGGQHATIEMRDGTSVSGTVLSSSPTELQLAGDDKTTRTIAMNQVKSIEYDDAAPADASAPAPAAAPAQPAPAASKTLKHREHYHPQESAVTTTTSELPAGTEISVRNEETIDSGKAAEGQTYPAEVTADVRDADG